jgi:hypothetical protein
MKKSISALLFCGLIASSGAPAEAKQAPPPSFEDVCPCESMLDGNPWNSHADYVACVTAEARRRRASSVIRAGRMRAGIRAAKRSTCGDPNLVRCCIYANDEVEVGRCRMMSEDACDELDDAMESGEAGDEGPGSCLPNPCVF